MACNCGSKKKNVRETWVVTYSSASGKVPKVYSSAVQAAAEAARNEGATYRKG